MDRHLISNIAIICAGMFPFLCWAGEGLYPPSQYIGFYDEYLGVQNGCLPAGDQSFTGYWSWGKNGTTFLEGHYTNGIPSGVWNEFSCTGVKRRQCVYEKDNAFTETVYFPDGMPRLKVTGLCFYQARRVDRRIDSIKRMDEKPQAKSFPKIQMAPCSSLVRSLNTEYSEDYLMVNADEYRFLTFQYDFNSSQWKRNMRAGVVNWKAESVCTHQPPPQFPYFLSVIPSTLFLDITREKGGESSFQIVDKHLTTTKRDKGFMSSNYPALYVSELHSLADVEFSCVTTGEKTQESFYIRVSGCYLPETGWSDVIVEPVGMRSHLIAEPSVFPDIDETIPAGTELYFDYKCYGRQYTEENPLEYYVFLDYNIFLGSGRLWLHKVVHGGKYIPLEKYRVSE